MDNKNEIIDFTHSDSLQNKNKIINLGLIINIFTFFSFNKIKTISNFHVL